MERYTAVMPCSQFPIFRAQLLGLGDWTQLGMDGEVSEESYSNASRESTFRLIPIPPETGIGGVLLELTGLDVTKADVELWLHSVDFSLAGFNTDWSE